MIQDLCKFLYENDEDVTASSLVKSLLKLSTSLEQLDELARTAFEIREYKLAVTILDTIGSKYELVGEDWYSYISNLINSLAHANEPERALQFIEKLEELKKDDYERDLKKIYTLYLLNRKKEAEVLLRAVLSREDLPDKTRKELMFNSGTYDLYNGDFYKGLYNFLHYGRDIGIWKKPQLPCTLWDGQDIEGKTLIILAEAGIGDEFINIRFMKNLEKLKINAIWYSTRKDLVDLYNRIGYNAIYSINGNLPEDIYWCHSMDLPVLLKLDGTNLYTEPYLSADGVSSIIPNGDKLKVGVRWQGNPKYDNNLHRNLDLDGLLSCIDTNKYDVYSLQRDDGQEDILEYPYVTPLYKGGGLDSWEETLRTINALDIVITSCTSVAHASAAMGKRTIVITPISEYYVWCGPHNWYGDHVTVIRQDKPREWLGAYTKLKELL